MTALTNAEFMDRLWDTFVEVDANLPAVLFVYRDDEALAAAQDIKPEVAAQVAPIALVGFRADEVVFIMDTYLWHGTEAERAGRTPFAAFSSGDPHASEGLMFQRCFQDGSYTAGHIMYVRDPLGTGDLTKATRTGDQVFDGPLSGRGAVSQEMLATVAEHWNMLYRATESFQLSSLAADMVAAKVLAREWGVEFSLYYSSDDNTERDAAIAEAERLAEEFSVNASVRALPDEGL